MSNEIEPCAYYDCLSISVKLSQYFDGFSRKEIFIFTYISLILFVYDKKTIAEWKYRFIVDEEGFPFSKEVDESVDRHIQNGNIEEKDNRLELTSKGNSEFNKLKNLEMFITREQYLETVCTSSITTSYTQVIQSSIKDPKLLNAVRKKDLSEQWVIEDVDTSEVYESIQKLVNEIGISEKNIIIPAIAWINHLIDEKENSTDE